MRTVQSLQITKKLVKGWFRGLPDRFCKLPANRPVFHELLRLNRTHEANLCHQQRQPDTSRGGLFPTSGCVPVAGGISYCCGGVEGNDVFGSRPDRWEIGSFANYPQNSHQTVSSPSRSNLQSANLRQPHNTPCVSPFARHLTVSCCGLTQAVLQAILPVHNRTGQVTALCLAHDLRQAKNDGNEPEIAGCQISHTPRYTCAVWSASQPLRHERSRSSWLRTFRNRLTSGTTPNQHTIHALRKAGTWPSCSTSGWSWCSVITAFHQTHTTTLANIAKDRCLDGNGSAMRDRPVVRAGSEKWMF